MLPYHDSNKNLVETIDKMIRANDSIDKILETTNKKILIENYGFTEKEVQIAGLPHPSSVSKHIKEIEL